MPEILVPLSVPAGGGKSIEEVAGAATTGDERASVARMRAPAGWSEPGQRPDFDEVTVVLAGELVVEHEGGRLTVGAGQAVRARSGEWVRYSAPGPAGAEYVAVCTPAFTPDAAHRDA